MSDNDALVIPDEVYRQLEAVRKSGVANMLTEIDSALRECDFAEATEWVEDNRTAYYEHALSGGFKPESEAHTETHEIVGDEPMWVPVTYTYDAESESVDATCGDPTDLIENKRRETTYQCSCGRGLVSYDAVVEHLQEVNSQ